MKKALLLLSAIVLFSCSKSNDVKPLALTIPPCSVELDKSGMTLYAKRENTDTSSITYNKEGVPVSAHNKKLSSDNTFIYYSDCYIDSVYIQDLKVSYNSNYYKVVDRDGDLPKKVNLFYRDTQGGNFKANGVKEFFYSSDKKTLTSIKWNGGSANSVNIPSVTKTDLFFVIIY